MTDLYIEQATSAFQQLWTGGGQLSTSMPQIVDVLQGMQRQIKVLESSYQSAQTRADLSDNLVAKLRDEIGRLQSVENSNMRRLDLLEGNDGFVTKTELLSHVRMMPEVESIRLLREQSTSAHQRIVELTSDIAERQKALEDRVTEAVRHQVQEETRSLKTQFTRFDEDHQSAVQRLTTSIAKLQGSMHEMQATSSREIRERSEQLHGELRSVQDGSRRDLDGAVTEVLNHLKQQARIIDTLQEEMRVKSAAIPTVDVIEAFREEMRNVRGDLDRAQFRMHEAYTQMMSLSKMASMSSTSVPSSAHVAASLVTPIPNAPLNDSNSTASQWASLVQPPAAYTEAALEPIKRDLAKLQTSTIPALSTALSAQRDTVQGLVDMHRRAQGLLSSLMSCVGLRDRLDELFSSLESRDAGHVVLMLRSAFDSVYPASRRAASMPVGTTEVTQSHGGGTMTSSTYNIGSVGPMYSGATQPQQHSNNTSQFAAPAPAAATHSSSAVSASGSYTPRRGSGGPTNAIAGGQHTPLHYRRSDVGAATSTNTSSAASSTAQPQAHHPFQLGVDVADGTSGGALIMAVLPRSVAKSVGLEAGETILRVNGQLVEGASAFAQAMRQAERLAVSNGGSIPSISLVVRGVESQRTRIVDVPLPS